MKIKEFSEKNIIDFIYRRFFIRKYKILVPNIYLFDWESDMLGITQAGYLNEFEIKISHADFKADFDKINRHNVIETGIGKNKKWSGAPTITAERPNYFWYICPKDVISLEEIPKYAGLIYVNKYDNDVVYLVVVVKAPLLHKEKITEKQKTKIITSFVYKYWNLRIRKV